MINQELKNKLKGVSLKVDTNARTSSFFLGEDLNVSLIALIVVMSLKNFSSEIKITEMQIILGNVFLRRYKLEKIIAEAITSSPHVCEKTAEAIVFLEMSGLVEIYNDSEKQMRITKRGEDFLGHTRKMHSSLIRNIKILLISLKKEGLAFS